MKDIGEKLQIIYNMHKENDKLANELEKLIGRMVVTEDDNVGFISSIDYDKGLIIVEFGLRSGTDFRIGCYSSNDLINGKLKLE